MIPKSGYRFRKRSCSTNGLECDDASKKSHHALVKSLRLDARRLDDRPPPVDLGPLIGAERFRRQLLARRDVHVEETETLTHVGIRQGLDNRAIDLGNGLG